MSPLLLLIPLAGVAVYLAWPKGQTQYAPLPPTPGVLPASGGARYMTYVQRIDTGLFAYRTAKIIGGTALTAALAEVKGTLDVVKGMAEADRLQGQITTADMTSINVKIDAAKKEIGA